MPCLNIIENDVSFITWDSDQDHKKNLASNPYVKS